MKTQRADKPLVVTGSLRPGEAIVLGPAQIQFLAGGRICIAVAGAILTVRNIGLGMASWSSRTRRGPHPLKSGDSEEPLLILGPGGDYQRSIFPSDLAAEESNHDASPSMQSGAADNHAS